MDSTENRSVTIPRGTIPRLRLNSLENTRKSYARILRMYARGELLPAFFRNLVYGMTGFLSYWKLEADLEIEKRLEAIERRLEQGR